MQAQNIKFEGSEVTPIVPPQGEEDRAFEEQLRRSGVQARISYVDLENGTVEAKEPPIQPPAAERPALIGGTGGIFLVILILGAMLALWFYVGGRPLLAADPTERERKAAPVPEGWSASAADLTAADPLADIAAMTDRRAALVRLLRLCLLQASTATTTAFRRADTERVAYRRLPGSWPGTEYLRRLLQSAELAHYGGRDVREQDFAALIEGARAILPGRTVRS